METEQVKKALVRALEKPSSKRMSKLAENVLSLCDAYDSRDTMQALLQDGHNQLMEQFNMLDRFRRSLHG